MVSKTNILILTRALPYHCLGGMEQITLDLAQNLQNNHCNVCILTTNIPQKSEVFYDKDLKIINLKSAPSKKYTNSWWTESVDYYIKNLADTTDIILSVSSAGKAFLKLKKEGSLPCKILLQCHGTSIGEIKTKFQSGVLKKYISCIRNFYWLLQDSKNFKNYDGIFSVGSLTTKELKNPLFKLNGTNIFEIHNGINDKVFYPKIKKPSLKLKINENSLTFITVCRIHKEKGILESFNYIKNLLLVDKKLNWIVIGDGPELKSLKNLVSKHNLQKNIFVIGKLDRNIICQYLALSDFFLFLTKRNEGLPLNILEALSCGIPIICSKKILHLFPKHSYYFKDFLSLNSLYSLKSKYNCNSKKKLIDEKYTLDYCARQYYNVFRKYIDQKK